LEAKNKELSKQLGLNDEIVEEVVEEKNAKKD
jgi:hypothetical protein